MKTDRSIRILLGITAILLGANLLIMAGVGPATPTAQAAGIPDSGAQFQSMIDQLTDLNKKVDKLDSFLESGALVVKVKDEKKDKDK